MDGASLPGTAVRGTALAYNPQSILILEAMDARIKSGHDELYHV
jgi:hypothetical protein